MKLLLTSAGLTNKSIINALATLVGKPFSETILAFIPTAANVEQGSKEWLIDDLRNFQKLHLKELDIVDIAALPKERFLPRLERADVLVFGGGNTYYLLQSMITSGLYNEMNRLLQDKVYVGISAGSMITTKRFDTTWKHDVGLYDEEIISHEQINEGLGLVDFHIIPHLNSLIFPKVRLENIKEYATKTSDTIYALDDNSAISVRDDIVSVVSEGIWEKFS